jgi:hypothetical protein
MPGYNTKFDLSVEDLDVIEEALRHSTTQLASSALEAKSVDTPELTKAKHIRDLLGRLHNQKIFYRPKTGAYISG